MNAALVLLLALGQNNPPPMNNPPPPAPTISAPMALPPPPSPGIPGALSATPAPSAVSDPVARRLNLALGLAGGLRKEVAEGRGGGERAGRLLKQLQDTMIGLRKEGAVKDRKPSDEVWSKPLADAQAQIDEMMALPMQYWATKDGIDRTTRMYETLSEASRKRHETAQNSIRNIK